MGSCYSGACKFLHPKNSSVSTEAILIKDRQTTPPPREGEQCRPTSASEIQANVSSDQNIENRVQLSHEAFEKLNDDSDGKSESLKKDKKRKKKKKEKYKGIEEERRTYQREKKHLEDELTQLKEEHQGLKKEKDDLLTRLSAVAGARLTDNNPNITDLSDTNRPTKLSEQYSELYDNEWTDAFDVLSRNGDRETEERACRILLDIFCFIYNASFKKANTELYNTIDGIKAFLGNQDPSVDVIKHLKDQRKKNSVVMAKDKMLQQEIKSGLKEILHSKRIRKDERMKSFLDTSIRLCWLMVVQDPPVFVDTNIERCDEMYDSNELKAYTKSGNYIDYIVWPPLYLVKGGNLLCKGIAQCKTETSSNISRQILLKEQNGDRIKEDKMQSTKSKGNMHITGIFSNSTVGTLTSQDQNLIGSEASLPSLSPGDNAVNDNHSYTGVKKNSIGKKIKSKGSKGQKTTYSHEDKKKPREVTSTNVLNCDESNNETEKTNENIRTDSEENEQSEHKEKSDNNDKNTEVTKL